MGLLNTQTYPFYKSFGVIGAGYDKTNGQLQSFIANPEEMCVKIGTAANSGSCLSG